MKAAAELAVMLPSPRLLAALFTLSHKGVCENIFFPAFLHAGGQSPPVRS
ncbi:hypothetical protein [Geobacillus sp. ZGt-1]|nr:hypothetical protein [Geobacillus sp. ZGt-1]